MGILVVNVTPIRKEAAKLFTSSYDNFIQTAGILDGASYCAKALSVFYVLQTGILCKGWLPLIGSILLTVNLATLSCNAKPGLVYYESIKREPKVRKRYK